MIDEFLGVAVVISSSYTGNWLHDCRWTFILILIINKRGDGTRVVVVRATRRPTREGDTTVSYRYNLYTCQLNIIFWILDLIL